MNLRQAGAELPDARAVRKPAVEEPPGALQRGRGRPGEPQRRPARPPLFFEFVAYAAREPKARARLGEWFDEMRATLAELVSLRAAQLGIDPALPPAQLALAISALANGMLIEVLLDPRGSRIEAFDEFVTLLVRGTR